MQLLHDSLEYLILIGQSQHSAVMYFCIMTSKLYLSVVHENILVLLSCLLCFKVPDLSVRVYYALRNCAITFMWLVLLGSVLVQVS